MFRKLRFIGSVSLLYLFTIGTASYLLQPPRLFTTPVHAASAQSITPSPKPHVAVISGKPIRITIPDYAIDLPVDEGQYQPEDGSWTLSDTRAQFALISVTANNAMGNTFIYGHGTDAVFGKLGRTVPTQGTVALLSTDNGHVFTYRFQEARNLTATDTWIFDDVTSGPPRLTVQTCTGSFSEWRTMFTFTFEKVARQ